MIDKNKQEKAIDELLEAVKVNAKKASKQETPATDAMKLTQAAVNASNAIATLLLVDVDK